MKNVTFTTIFILMLTNPVFSQDDDLKFKFYFNNKSLVNTVTGNSVIKNNALFVKDRFGQKSSALLYSGDSTFTNLGSNLLPYSGSISVSVWIYPLDTLTPSDTINRDPYNNAYIYSSGGQTNSIGDYIIWNKGALNVGRKTSTDSANIDYAGFAVHNEWHHLVFIFDRSDSVMKSTLYLDGVVISEDTIYHDTYTKTFNNCVMGKPNNADNYFFRGYIDDIRGYSNALTNRDVLQLYYENPYSKVIVNKSDNDKIVVFPNPVKDKVQISTGNLTMTNITLLTLNGECLINKDIKSEAYELNLSELETGTYILRIGDNNQFYYKKIIRK